MNKKLIGSIVLASGLLFSVSAIPHKAAAQVMWGNQELVKGQIGKVTILQDTPLYHPGANGELTIVRTLKKGSIYRIYSFKHFNGPLYYGVGGSYYVKASSQIKYETPSKAKLQALGVAFKKQTLQPGIDYPKITMLTSKTIEANINNVFYQKALDTQKKDAELKVQEEQDKKDGLWFGSDYVASLGYSVAYNQDNILSIKFDSYMYTGGAHGMEFTEGSNFDLMTGKQLTLSDVITSSTQLQKVNQYIKSQMVKRDVSFRSEFKSVDLKNDEFYYTNGGIVIVFQEYQYASYAEGILNFKVPYTVFK